MCPLKKKKNEDLGDGRIGNQALKEGESEARERGQVPRWVLFACSSNYQ